VQPAATASPAALPAPNRLRLAEASRPRMVEGFVPVELVGRTSPSEPAAPDALAAPPELLPPGGPPPVVIQAAETAEAWATRDSFFGDLEL